MKTVFISNVKGVTVRSVPNPSLGENEILVANAYSVISSGTESQTLRNSAQGALSGQLRQPVALARKAAGYVLDNGVRKLLERAVNPPETLEPLGYSSAGGVVAVGRRVLDIHPGDRVACAGAQFAHHAQMVAVPRLLAARIPNEVSTLDAAFTTLGAIAMQGLRRAGCGQGETVVVIGLGLLGLLGVQLAAASGLRVVGLDPVRERRERATCLGADFALDPGSADVKELVADATSGFGADSVLLFAATSSSQPVNLAFDLCRQRGRVVVVGSVGLNLDRERMYRKELDLVVSTSYGPGRYDPLYEIEGVDYPIGYVRWTENRQMEAFLDLLARRRIAVDQLVSGVFPIDEAERAYEFVRGEDKPVAVLLEYPADSNAALPRTRTVPVVAKSRALQAPLGLAVVGLGGFVLSRRLPDIATMPSLFRLHATVSSRGQEAIRVAKAFGASRAETDLRAVLDDPAVDLVLIGSRHDSHAGMTKAALEAGKAVFVEKPLCLTVEELDEIERTAVETGTPLFLGFNRRYSPCIRATREVLAGKRAPFLMTYRVNVGPVPSGHWTLDPALGGGRIIGEACHFFDLFLYLLGSDNPVTQVSVQTLAADGPPRSGRNNLVTTVVFTDGSVATLVYTLLGHQSMPKERAEVFAEGTCIVLDDYRSLTLYGADTTLVQMKGAKRRGRTLVLPGQDKGWRGEMLSVGRQLTGETSDAIALSEVFGAMRLTFEVEALTRGVDLDSHGGAE